MSPVQTSSSKLEPCPDPEKKFSSFGRASGTRLHPSVNALASSSTSSLSSSSHDSLFDPFRSPPPPQSSGLAAAKAHLRSPSARLQAALTCSTPGGTKGRYPLGYSPSLAAGAAPGGAWGMGHGVSSSRSGAAGWEEEGYGGGAVGGAFAWPGTPGVLRSEW